MSRYQDTIDNLPLIHSSPGADILEAVDLFRLDASRQLDRDRQVQLGQFMTPVPVAMLLASMFEATGKTVRLLDAGAGVGSLLAAFVAAICEREERPKELVVTAYELDEVLVPYLEATLKLCQEASERAGIRFRSEIITADFIKAGVSHLQNPLFLDQERYHCAILNPPYRKIRSDSAERLLLESIGVKTGNLYTAFLAVAARLVTEGGELVAITPRSFCNGPYFKPFRQDFLGMMAFREIHVFESRDKSFDKVLQENIIFRMVKSQKTPMTITVTASESPTDELPIVREVPYVEVVRPDDPEAFVHIVADDLGGRIAKWMAQFTNSLEDLGLTVSTGRVVDFRASNYLRKEPESGAVPLIYPCNFASNYIAWPVLGKKPQALALNRETESLLVPQGRYVLVKRFSSKEEPRRVVAALYDPEKIRTDRVGFENHLNYFHQDGEGLPERLAKGLASFLNSTLLDTYFRQFNGHTQVNATDLRNLKYPSREALESLGARIGEEFPTHDALDNMVEQELSTMANDDTLDPVKAKKKIEEVLTVLASLGLPRQQLNERSALTLLALLDLKSDTSWSEARDPLMGITPMMDYFAEHYGKTYKPNTRETVRRQTVHQFLDAGIILYNPDKPDRPPNSPHAVYQIEPSVLKLLRTFGTAEWERNLEAYLATSETLRTRYAQEREMRRIPVTLSSGVELKLSPGGQNELIEKIINEFSPRFAPGGKVIYLGDTDQKMLHFDREALKALGVVIEEHGKMPDVVIHYTERNWLLLIEAVTSHGPVDPKRVGELKALFKDSKAGLVFVTTFLTRKDMIRYLDQIAWETEVWVAEAPGHMIHFNGERFLGPYE